MVDRDEIPFSRPYIGIEEQLAVERVLESGWLTIGKEVKEFERELRHICRVNYAITTDSCTSALTISLKALAHRLLIEHPNMPLVAAIPALTFVATANAAVQAGYDVVFVDVDKSGSIDTNKLWEHPARPVMSVVVPVHFAGNPCDLYSLWETKIPVIEDAAHALGAKFSGRPIGSNSPSVATCFSFYPTKTITTIEGGAIITSDPDAEFIDRLRTLSLHGLGADHIRRYERSSLNRPVVGDYGPGYKANMTDVEAAIGREQLKKLDFILTRRRQIAMRYINELTGYVNLLYAHINGNSWHIFVLLVDDRDAFVSRMRDAGVNVGIHYSPIIPAHPYYQARTKYQEGHFPVAESIASRCVSLPLWPGMTDDMVDRVIATVKEVV